MRGLIASVLGGVSKGVGQVAAGQIELNSRKALMEAEEEMRARLAEAAESRAEKQQIRAEDRARANIPLDAQAAADAEAAILQQRFGEGSTYPGLLQSQMRATETPAQRATREAAEADTTWTKEERELRRKLMSAGTETERDEYARQLGAMGGDFGPSNRSYSDVVALGNGYARMANDSLKMAEEAYDDDERQGHIDDAKRYQRLADNAFQGVTSARLPGGAGEPRITTDEEYDALPSGTVFIDPTGTRRTKP